MDLLSCYYVLGVPPGRPIEDVRRAYLRLALRHHPDRNAQDPNGHAEFCRITEAYSTLRQALIARMRIGMCQKCGRVLELFRTVEGQRCCVECCLNTRGRFLPLPQVVTVLCLATIIFQLAAAGCGFHFAATGEPAYGLMGLVFGLLSFASLAYYLWIAEVIEAPPSKRWKKLSGRLDTTSGGMLAVLVFLLLLLLLAAMYLFADLWFPSMDARQGFFPQP